MLQGNELRQLSHALKSRCETSMDAYQELMWDQSPQAVGYAAVTLRDRFAAQHGEAASFAGHDPARALERVEGLRIIEDPTLRGRSCPIDAVYDVDTKTIKWRPSRTWGRDNFTLLHELGHHLLAEDEDWQYGVIAVMGDGGLRVEERVVSAFAARLLLPDDLVAGAFKSGVTAAAIRDLAADSASSASACLARALDLPGDRLVMLTDLDGRPYFSLSNGEPYSPGRGVPQPAVARAADNALNRADHSHRLVGGEGVVYRSGRANTRVVFDVAVDGAQVFVVVESTPYDNRVDDRGSFHIECIEGCGESFVPQESPGQCAACREYRCPRCSRCDCNIDVYCERCFVAIPVQRVSVGIRVCEICE